MSKTVKESQSIISIHAPTRGATYKPPLTNPVNGISIHAPTRGATVPFFYLVSYFLLFQSTLLQEERRNRLCRLSCKYKISIHAPTRGATGAVGGVAMTESISIHAPTRGATRRPDTVFVDIDHFNPRSYKRSDSICSIFSAIYCISIHAPTRGATLSLFLHRRQI